MKQPLNVFIDTNIFQSKVFDVEDECFEILKRHVDENVIKCYTHKIILFECKQHISLSVESIVDELKLSKSLLKKKCISRRMVEMTELKEILLLKDKRDEIIAGCCKIFSQYIDSIKPTLISSSYANLEQIVSDYINIRLPFEKRKPEEFKDAIVISSIKQFFKDDECAIITNDNGFQKSFEGLGNFRIYPNLDELFDFINKDSMGFEFVRANKEAREMYLREQILERFSSIESIDVENAEYDRKGCPDDYEFDDYEIEEISVENIEEPKILEILDNGARLSCRCEVEYSILGKVIDFASAVWDSEEHRYIELPTTEYHDKYSVSVIVNFTVNFSEDKAEFSDFKTDDDILLNRYNRTQREKSEIGYLYEDD